MDEFFDSETMFGDETVAEQNGTGALQTAQNVEYTAIEGETSPVTGGSLERVLGLFDSETTRLQELRGKLTGNSNSHDIPVRRPSPPPRLSRRRSPPLRPRPRLLPLPLPRVIGPPDRLRSFR